MTWAIIEDFCTITVKAVKMPSEDENEVSENPPTHPTPAEASSSAAPGQMDLLQQLLSCIPSAPTPPPALKLDVTANKSDNWKLWKQQWENYAILSHLENQPVKFRMAKFLSTIGEDAIRIYNSMVFEPTEYKSDLDCVMKKFEKFAIGEGNTTYERYLFNSINQNADSIDQFLTKLISQAKTCNFCSCMHDTLIRDRIILGVKDDSLRKRLLAKDLDLDKCIRLCKAEEANELRYRTIRGETETANKVRVKPKKPFGTSKSKPREEPATKIGEEKECRFCPFKHVMKKENALRTERNAKDVVLTILWQRSATRRIAEYMECIKKQLTIQTLKLSSLKTLKLSSLKTLKKNTQSKASSKSPQ